MDNSVYCNNDQKLILLDRLVATTILVLYFLVGSVGNVLYICIYLRKQRKRNGFHSRGKTVKPKFIRLKYYANNKAIYTLSISNLILSGVFIPYTVLVRIWNVEILNHGLAIKMIEHAKDSFIYMNLLILIILSLERYVAVCKPHHYKTLETNINKIIWLFFLLGFLLAMTNYQNNAKSEFNCSIAMNHSMDLGHFLFTFEGHTKALNSNLLTSVFLFSVSACLSTWFYVQIGRYEWKRSRNRNRLYRLATKPQVVLENEDEGQTSTSLNSKSNASVQTDLVVDNRLYYRKLSTNFLSSETITKISIWLSVIIWASILPFLLTALRIIPYFKCVYFLFHTENVFSPIVYVCLNKRYRVYLIKSFRKIYK